MSLWQDLKVFRGERWSRFYLLLKALQKHQQPFWSSKAALLDCGLQQDKENSVLLGETRKLQTNLLPAHYVCAWRSLSSSLALSPAGLPKVTTICSYRGSFGSLGSFPFSLPLWNSDVSLSTTLLHIPTCAAKSQLAVSFLPNSSPGNFPNELAQVLSGTVFASPPKNPQSGSIVGGRQDNARKQSFSCCIAKSFYQKGQQNTAKGDETRTKSPSELKKQWCAFQAVLRRFTQWKPFPVVSILLPKKSLIPVSTFNCASH